MKHIAGWFRRNNTLMAQAKDLARQLQEAWADNERLKNASAYWWDRLSGCREDQAYTTHQLHRVARERDEERRLRLEAEATLEKIYAVNEAELPENVVARYMEALENEEE